MHINCPHCQNPIEVIESAGVKDVACPSCGSVVSLSDLRTRTETATQPPLAKIGRFTLTEWLGEGGFGTVWRAKDMDLGRDVAVKLPRKDVLGGAEFEERFMREARAAANLKHDGIVTVHEVGRQDGTIYIVSDFVHGVNLAEWLTAQRPDPRQAAELVAQIAEALGHAHRQGVVHRDIKPANIMLRMADGSQISDLATLRPVVMDFGLAKREAAEVAITRDGRHLGTPAYMSPEQARGESHAADARSDVWSLGVMLYELLTAERPFRGAERMILLQILQDEPRSPRWLNDSIPRDLETITLKCLSKEPARRYPSATDLSAELRRWLAGEPIHARPISAPERLWRWSKRNPRVAALSAAVFLLLLTIAVGASVAASIVGQSNRLLAAKNLELDAKNTELEQANQRERDAAAVAREQSQLALKSLESVIFDIQAKLINVQGAGDLQRALLQTAIDRLQEVSDQFVSRSTIDENTAAALIDLGDVFLRIGSMSPLPATPVSGDGGDEPSSDSDGPLITAQRVYQRASDIDAKLASADPNNAEAQRNLSLSYVRLGDVSRQAGKLDDALGYYTKYSAISQKLAEADPDNVEAERDLGVSYNKLGDVSWQVGKLNKAREYYTIGLTISEKLASADPNNAEAQFDLSVSYRNLGDANRHAGKLEEALEYYTKAVAVSQKLASVDPNNTQVQRHLSSSIEMVGGIYEARGKLSEAHEQYDRMLSIKKRLAENDPADAIAQSELSFAYCHLGDVNLTAAKLDEALGNYTKSLAIRLKLAAADPNNAEAQRDLFVSYTQLGDVSKRADNLDEALEYYTKGLTISQKLASADPNNAQALRDLSGSYNRLGNLREQAGNLDEAMEYYRKFLAISQKLASADPDNAESQRDLSVSYTQLGDASEQAGNLDGAMEYYTNGLAISQKLASADPMNIQAQFDLLACFSKLGSVQHEQKHYKQAIWQCQHEPTALGDWKILLEQPANLLPVLLDLRGQQFVQDGRTADAVQAVAKLRELGTATGGQLYNAACVYTLCAAGIKGEKETDKLTAEQSATRQQHITEALATLREAIAAGWKDFAHMQKDPDLAPLRDLPEFKALLPKP